MRFEKALYNVKNGGAIQRSGWNGKGLYVEMIDHVPPDIAKFLVIKSGCNGLKYPWVPSQGDLLADDWLLISAWGDITYDYELHLPICEVER